MLPQKSVLWLHVNHSTQQIIDRGECVKDYMVAVMTIIAPDSTNKYGSIALSRRMVVPENEDVSDLVDYLVL